MRKLNQSGAVSMISMVIFATIITILVTAYARTIVAQQRESINYDLSARAFYGAEAGAQDAIRSLKNNTPDGVSVNGRDKCGDGVNTRYLNGEGGGGNGQVLGEELRYTCQLVKIEADRLVGETGSNSGIWRIEPSQNTTDRYKLIFNWSKGQNQSGSGAGLVSRADSSKLFPPASEWVNNNESIHPVLRVSLVTVKKSEPNLGLVQQRVYFLNPAQSSNGEISFDSMDGESSDAIVHNASCQNSNISAYACTQTLSLSNSFFGNHVVYAVVHQVYSNRVEYEINMRSAANDKIPFKGIATVDVTARAGNVFRRIQQTVNLGHNYNESWFDAPALVVGNGICKKFSTGNSASDFQSDCDPLDLN